MHYFKLIEKARDRLKILGKSNKAVLILVLVSYLFFTIFYMGPSTWRCGDTLYGFGDNTAGPVWRFGLEPKQAPLGSYENVTNYPKGEDLYNPVNYSLAGQSYMIWASSRVFGPICGYNLINATGFIASALVMFGFIYALTRRKWIAWIAGFAVSFSPYYQMKVGGHPGYGYQALIIGLAWSFFNMVKRRRKKDIVLTAVLYAACFYFDPYFSLLSSAVLIPLTLTWIFIDFKISNTKKLNLDILKNKINIVTRMIVIFSILLMPLLFVAIKNSKKISSDVSALRGNVLFEARACSNLPHEYATPFALNPIFERAFDKAYYNTTITNLANDFTCGIGEDSIGISLVIITTTALSLIIICWERINKRRIKLQLGYDKKLVLIGISFVLLTAVIFALPPVKAFGIVPSPSFILLKITTTWRTLARFYVVVNFAMVTLFSVSLVFIASNINKPNKYFSLILLVLFSGVLIEYQAFKPFTGNRLSTFSYAKDVPTVYNWIKGQNDIKVIAEYPLEKSGGESNAMAYYLSMQNAHKKKLFNGSIPTGEDERIKDSLKDISDPQTLDALSAAGVDTVVIHGVDEAVVKQIKNLKIVYSSKQDRFNMLSFTPLVKNDNVIVVKILSKPTTSSMLSLHKGFARNTFIINSAADWNYEATNGSEIKIIPLPGKIARMNKKELRCFDLRTAGDNVNVEAKFIVDGKETTKKDIGPQFTRIEILASDSIVINNDKSYNMQVGNLGCSNY